MYTNGTKEEIIKQFNGLYASSEKMTEILRAFGRFPHRNEMLGRQNTDKELTFFETGELP